MSSSISDAAATKINKMNRAAQDVSMGTLMQGFEDDIDTLQGRDTISGSMLIYALHTNASMVTIPTGLGNIVGFNIQVYNAGSQVSPGFYVDSASGSLKIMAVSGCSVLTANEKLYWIAW